MGHVRASMLAAVAGVRDQWTAAQANGWYEGQPWLVGANYVPANAINQLDMWQAATFDPATIDKALGWAAGLGMNTMRVYLHNLLGEEDAEGFTQRIDAFLAIAAKHGIKPMFVLFDSCWDPDPRLGPQHPPIPGGHNSGWVQAPGRARLEDTAQYDKLEAYVKGVVGAFADDERILAWDVWNEPDNDARRYPRHVGKQALVEGLLDDVFAWARSADPAQPLTSGVWQPQNDDWSSPATQNASRRSSSPSPTSSRSTIIAGRNRSSGACGSFRGTAGRSSAPNICRAAAVRPSIPSCRSARSTISRCSTGASSTARLRRGFRGTRGSGLTRSRSRWSGSTT